ncbi:carbon-nitrogen hydrolase [Azomonas macrocytogenes]|uniref:Carbon-nitrogen hydrolase n=1 Tax=Azomonas macrocytogenes TaxID=69962 RepID=A0A839T920_AZOMA|nr:carbon-nitrogen hydrolase [Azomonas macrocytogenes]MBB3104724.1 hypothetical protein [Azomonas macrocytogenes]
MRTLFKLTVLAIVGIIALIVYLDWTGKRHSGPLLSDLRPLTIQTEGPPGNSGNLLGLETPLRPADYQSRERLHLKFATYLDQARHAGFLNERTIVVLPEHVGTGLFAIGEKAEVQQARTLRDAMHWMAMSNPWRYLQFQLDNQSDDRRTEAVLRIKAREMAEAYQEIFGNLAKEYGVTLVAGSIVLPEPKLRDGQLQIGDGPLQQISLVFDSRGQPTSLTYKYSLSRYEKRYSSAPKELRPDSSPTPAGKLRVLLGCDAYSLWQQPQAHLLAVTGAQSNPAACPGAQVPTDLRAPMIEIQTLGLPWNLLGSPKRPAHAVHTEPGRMLNLWLSKGPQKQD